MLFNSITFLIFFLVFYGCYLALNHKGQNILLIIASYLFYGAWDWRFLGLLIWSTVLDYTLAKKMDQTSSAKSRKLILCISIIFNLGLLCFFKYFNFFSSSLTVFLAQFGWEMSLPFLKVILPLGISFYTFQTMGYMIDVYRRETPACRSFLDFALFVAFFPQLIAGPIEKASHMLPQITTPRAIKREGIRQGLGLFFWGLFKKVVIADNVAFWVNKVFAADAAGIPGFMALSGAYAFAFQIYGDFSGYSDMARGLAKFLGFDLRLNFKKPYLAASPSEFWQRWHISLSQWLKSYLYIPLGGNRGKILRTCFNLMITMILGGLWHGANWTFILWGAYHGLLLVFYRLFVPEESANASKWRPLKIFAMFHLVCFGWIFFRAETVSQALMLIRQIFFDFRGRELFELIAFSGQSLLLSLAAVLLPALYGVNYLVPEKPKFVFSALPWPLRFAGIAGLGFAYLLFAVMQANQFIYFQF